MNILEYYYKRSITRTKKFIENPLAIFPFIKKRLYYNFIADSYIKKYDQFKHLTPEETLNHIIENNLSLIRFGDGSIDLVVGFSIYFSNWRQKYDKKLSTKIEELMRSKSPSIFLAFPFEFLQRPKSWFYENNSPKGYTSWSIPKIKIQSYLHKDILYGSSYCFYPKINTNINIQKLKEFFSKKNIIIVGSNTQNLSHISLGKTTHFVNTPDSDAWQQYNTIKNNVYTLLKDKNFAKEDTLILASFAEAAKILVYELTADGYTAWDTGQFFILADQEIKKIKKDYNN